MASAVATIPVALAEDRHRHPGDSHYGRWEAMEWCEQNGVRYVFGLARNATLESLVQAKTNAVSAHWESTGREAVRDYTETSYAAKSWSHSRRVVARIEATYKGLDTRYVVTNIARCGARNGSMTVSIARVGRPRT